MTSPDRHPTNDPFDLPLSRRMRACVDAMFTHDPALEAVLASIHFSNSVSGGDFTAEIKWEGLDDEDDIDLLPLVRRFERQVPEMGWTFPLGENDVSPILSLRYTRSITEHTLSEDGIRILHIEDETGRRVEMDIAAEAEIPLTDVLADPSILLPSCVEALGDDRLRRPEILHAVPRDDGYWTVSLPVDALRIGGGEEWADPEPRT